MIRWEYEKERCKADPERIHRMDNGKGRGFVCNACGVEVESGPIVIEVHVDWEHRAHICAACAVPWLALVARLKIPPEDEGLDVTDYSTLPLPRSPDFCGGCETDERRAKVKKEKQRDRSWLRLFLQMAGLK